MCFEDEIVGPNFPAQNFCLGNIDAFDQLGVNVITSRL